MPAIGKQALQRSRTDSKAKRNDKESKVESPAPSGIEDPVEGSRQKEKGEEMQDFWIDLGNLGGTESDIGRTEENKEECTCVGVSGS